MTTDWMITAHRPWSFNIPRLWRFLAPKHYVIAVERGKTGNPHIQARVKTSKTKEEVEKWQEQSSFLMAGIDLRLAEPKDIKEWQYERKEGLYICSWDTNENREMRFGRPTDAQMRFLDRLSTQNDREITVWYDPKGNSGKSWLCGHLWERGRCCYVMGTSGNPDRIIKDAVSAYDYSGLILIDLGRSTKWTPDLCEVLEHLKDGLIRDDRYSNKTINIRGVKVGVMCNKRPILDGLSEDRWDIFPPKKKKPKSIPQSQTSATPPLGGVEEGE